MEITLEKIELVKDRTGVTYKEAKDALESTDGNVVDAIIALEEKVDGQTTSKTMKRKDALIENLKELARKGNVSKVVITKDGQQLLNIPLTVGVLGTIIAPWGVIAGTVAAFGFNCKIHFITDDGKTIDVTEKAGELYDEAVVKGNELYKDFKENAPAMMDNVNDALSKAKDMAYEAKDKAVAAKEKFVKKTEENIDISFENSCEEESAPRDGYAEELHVEAESAVSEDEKGTSN